MASDLLSTIRREIDERLSELRPLLAERERLLGAIQALEEAAAAEAGSELVPEPVAAQPSMPVKPARRQTRLGGGSSRLGRRCHRAGRIGLEEVSDREAQRSRSLLPRTSPKPARAVRGAAREAILAALGPRLAHGWGAGGGHRDERAEHQRQPAQARGGGGGREDRARR